MTPFPEYIYKIVPSPPPSPLPHTLPLSTLDAQDGFIHISTLLQIPHTANLFFKDKLMIWLLKISSSEVEADGGELRWADGLPGCVHLYGREKGQWARLGEGVIKDVLMCERQGVDEDWMKAFEMLTTTVKVKH